MPDGSSNHEKQLLRDRARVLRSPISPAEILEKSEQICRNLMDVLTGANPLMGYVSKPMEVHTRALIGQLLAKGKTVVVTIFEKETKTLRLSYIEDPAVLSQSTFDVSEPVGHELPAQASDVKAVIIPMLAFENRETALAMVPAIMTAS